MAAREEIQRIRVLDEIINYWWRRECFGQMDPEADPEPAMSEAAARQEREALCTRLATELDALRTGAVRLAALEAVAEAARPIALFADMDRPDTDGVCVSLGKVRAVAKALRRLDAAREAGGG